MYRWEGNPFALRLASRGTSTTCADLSVRRQNGCGRARTPISGRAPGRIGSASASAYKMTCSKARRGSLWDGATAAATITVDTEEPLDSERAAGLAGAQTPSTGAVRHGAWSSAGNTRPRAGRRAPGLGGRRSAKGPRGGADPHRRVDDQHRPARLLRKTGLHPTARAGIRVNSPTTRPRRSSSADVDRSAWTTANLFAVEEGHVERRVSLTRPPAGPYDNPITICRPGRLATVASVPAFARLRADLLRFRALRTDRHAIAEF